MSEQDPETNGGLPPKISLKSKTSEEDTPKVSASTDAQAGKSAPAVSPAGGPKPITLRKPVAVDIKKPVVPVSPAGPKPITLQKAPPADAPVVKPAAPTPPATGKASDTAAEPSMAERALAEAKAEEKQGEAAPASPKAREAQPDTQASDRPAQAEATPPSPTAPAESPTADAEQPEPPAEKTAPARPVLSPSAPEGAPKRPVLRPAGAGANTIKRPAPVGIRKDGPDPLAAPGTKKSTSRITLPSSAEKSASGQIKTIKIAPKSQTGKIEGDIEASGSDDAKPSPKIDPKRQTSRISLESVLGGGSQQPNAPATIKIKRATPSAVEDKPALKRTGAIDQDAATVAPTPEPTEDAKPESQKKTLKVKRPAVASGDRPSVGGTSPMFTPPVPTGKIGEPEPHWAFSLIAIAATIVAGVLIYVLTAQVMDADQAEGPPGDGLPWPARYSP